MKINTAAATQQIKDLKDQIELFLEAMELERVRSNRLSSN
jgi:hypothetical protein